MKNFIVTFFFIIISVALFGQDDEPSTSSAMRVPFKDRVYVGGGFGASISSFYTNIEVSPLAGYMLTDRWSAGLGLTYIYSNNKFWDIKQNITGGRVFTRYQLFNFLFAHSEYEHLFLKIKEFANTPQESTYSIDVPGLLIGGGLSSGSGARSMAYLMVLYNVIHDPARYYNESPVLFRFGFNVGL